MPKENQIEVEIEDSLEDFLSDDNNASDTSDTKVSFQLDMDGNTVDNIELDEEEVTVEIENKEPQPKVQTAKPEPKVEPEPEPEDTSKQEAVEKKRKSRAKERIKTLNEKVKEQERTIAAQNQQMESMHKEFTETTSTYTKVELERLTADVARLEADLKVAADNGDGERIAAITKQLIESQGHIRNLQNSVNKESTAPAQTTPAQPTAPAESSLSDAAEDWMLGKEFLVDNDEYRDLTPEQRKKLSPVRQEMAAIAKQLSGEGFSPNDPLFFEEMDFRLSAKFDFYEGLAEDGLDALEYKNSETDPKSDNDASGETEKPQNSNKSKNVPAKGPSRSSSPNLSASNPNKVTMTQDMYSYWKKHLEPNGITLQEYAIEIKKDQQRGKF